MEQTMQIKEVTIRKYNRKTREYDRVVSLFEKYKIGKIANSAGGWQTIEIIGPKQTFVLCQCAKPLTKISPPLNDGEDAIQEKLPLFFVMTTRKVTKIQGATHFALRGDTLIPYASSGRGWINEIGA